jgi:nucleoside-diphosphate-sugar epimerase
MDKLLIIGGYGQIGSELSLKLSELYGTEHIIIADVKKTTLEKLQAIKYEPLDIRDKNRLREICEKNQITIIYNLAAILSAVGEQNPLLAYDINLNGLINVLEVAREMGIKKVFTPSSIAAFGPTTPRINTPQSTILEPTTMYGITKVAGELLGDYYVRKYGLDVRGIRYPGIISYETLPGGGTTDYAVEIFYEAIKNKRYTCFLRPDTRLPMMYMPDCLKATIELMNADFSKLKHHSNFNVAAFSFTPAELAEEIKKHIPDFEIEYKPDFRQQIADSWPQTIDDSAAREEWGWKPDYDLSTMTEDMLYHIRKKLLDN